MKIKEGWIHTNPKPLVVHFVLTMKNFAGFSPRRTLRYGNSWTTNVTVLFNKNLAYSSELLRPFILATWFPGLEKAAIATGDPKR